MRDHARYKIEYIFYITLGMSMLDNKGRLLARSGELFIDSLELAATGDRLAWAWHTICMAPFLSNDMIKDEAISVLKQLNNHVQDHIIDGVATRTAYICVSMGCVGYARPCAHKIHVIDKIFQERLDALHEIMRKQRIDLGESIKMSIEIPLRKEEAICAVARECAKMLDRPYVASCDINTASVPEGTWVSEILSSGMCTVAFKFGSARMYAQGCQLE